MLLRRNVLPRTVGDGAVTLFTLCIIPLVYYFELVIVLPKYFEMWSGWYIFHFFIGTFILYNVCANLIVTIFCDTSIRGRILPADVGSDHKLCAVCECVTPPRSWHCNICNVCILKRDHHCMFTSCCIGHENLRYFLLFVFYIFIATCYASYYNIFFVLEFTEFGTFESVFKILFPLAFIFVDYSQNQIYLFLIMIILIGGAFTGILFYYHLDLIIRGTITHERNHKMNMYDLGILKNIQVALGHRWYFVWISPFLESKLPNDGIHWEVKESNKTK